MFGTLRIALFLHGWLEGVLRCVLSRLWNRKAPHVALYIAKSAVPSLAKKFALRLLRPLFVDIFEYHDELALMDSQSRRVAAPLHSWSPYCQTSDRKPGEAFFVLARSSLFWKKMVLYLSENRRTAQNMFTSTPSSIRRSRTLAGSIMSFNPNTSLRHGYHFDSSSSCRDCRPEGGKRTTYILS